ncbi:DUF808 domain-containing protein [Acinetobacter qingfengensis]|uniref:Uncharacterized protein n=1 Tax=Acinetobacter qingfengensis TaxID=1262585 RepID=A0A1E7REU2_9GAMM|nr:DUF808 domain-containing protein [Acinetobacter qingfengensis]KAA8731173.1 DUF808 domain-containing protein [Acinetobacter qingfengensis]OEY97841.1 hypothetical protein BJI46_08050 [Acinetobacter qingfengensis]
MASSLLLLLDDIATVLDDVALMSKVAAKKTAGVLGDDLALNAQQVSGVKADRELSIVWRVTKGSLLNKVILVPLAMLISWFAPILVTVLLVIGGLFLSYEGVEKIIHSWHQYKNPEHDSSAQIEQELAKNENDINKFEDEKVKGAVRTDFILSAEIVVIALGTMAAATPFMTKFSVLALIALVMTIGVYGLVAVIVKIDDFGLYLIENKTGFLASIGRGLLSFAPLLMKTLSIVGTAAMFLVGGGIISHAIPFIHHATTDAVEWSAHLPTVGTFFGPITSMLMTFVIGAIAGLMVVIVVKLLSKIFGKSFA